MADRARCMFRYTVRVNGVPWPIDLASDPVHVGNGASPDEVDFWAEYIKGAPRRTRRFQVFGTGHPLPGNARHVGSCPRTQEGLVWHLYELVSDGEASDG